MPRKAKDKTNEIEEKPIKKSANKKVTSKKATTKKNVAKKTATKKTVSKKVTTSKRTSTSSKPKTTKATTTKESRTKTRKAPIEVLEYYDLPYRYNQTVVKILAQTPTTLFVYWDISDEDKEKYIKQYGEYFFNNTKPVLIVNNKTKNYSFEVDINDFANSWYLHVKDSNCDYQIELGRRPVNNNIEISNNYLYITNSNDMMSQNDHILFDKLSHLVYFKNVKTNEITKKNITNFSLLTKIGKFNIKEFYKKLYPNEIFDFDRLDLRNPSSSSSTFK